MKKTPLLYVLIVSACVCVSSFENAFAVIPEVRSAIVWNSGGETMLNLTIYHTPEIPSHHVDNIVVTMSGSSPQNFPQSSHVTVGDTFNVTVSLGPVSGTPSATAKAHCNIDGNSSLDWAGTVPEFSSLFLALLVFTVGSIALPFGARRRKTAA